MQPTETPLVVQLIDPPVLSTLGQPSIDALLSSAADTLLPSPPVRPAIVIPRERSILAPGKKRAEIGVSSTQSNTHATLRPARRVDSAPVILASEEPVCAALPAASPSQDVETVLHQLIASRAEGAQVGALEMILRGFELLAAQPEGEKTTSELIKSLALTIAPYVPRPLTPPLTPLVLVPSQQLSSRRRQTLRHPSTAHLRAGRGRVR